MRTTFRLNDNGFSGALRLTVGTESRVFDRETVLDLPDAPQLCARVTLVQPEDYIRESVHNPCVRGLLLGLYALFSGVFTALSASDGIRPEKLLAELCPFSVSREFTVINPAEKTLTISFSDTKYHHPSRRYTPPVLTVEGDGVTLLPGDTRFDASLFRRQWRQHHLPVWGLLALLTGFILFVCGAVTVQVYNRFAADHSVDEGIGLALCGGILLLMLGVTAALFRVAVLRPLRLAREVLRAHTDHSTPSTGAFP
ncbi:MAG: hypothetical protein IJZ13_08455 [Clostridia bacterium]|nr:hypothetical protein [Clostridia bacterium]